MDLRVQRRKANSQHAGPAQRLRGFSDRVCQELVARSRDVNKNGKPLGALVYYGLIKQLYSRMAEEGTEAPSLLGADD